MTRATSQRRAPRAAAAATLVAAWAAVLGALGLTVGAPLHMAFQAHVLCPIDGQLHHVRPSDDMDGAVEESRRSEEGGRASAGDLLAARGAAAVAHGGGRGGAHTGHTRGGHGGPSQPHSHDEAPCELGVLTHGTPLVAGSLGLVQLPAAGETLVVSAPAAAHAPISLQHLSPSHSPPA